MNAITSFQMKRKCSYVFDISEVLLLGTVMLVVLGPKRLPVALRTMGQWIARIRDLTTVVRHKTGIDEMLRAEGLAGGMNELRSPTVRMGGNPEVLFDKSREYPVEGPDAQGALPEDLVSSVTHKP